MVEIYNEHARSMDEEDVASLEEAHSQIVTLFEHCPKVLLQVFPQLEETLQHDNAQVRILSTNTLSTIFGLAGKYNLGVGSTGSHTIYRSTWEAWLKRRTDKAVLVRIAWVNGTKNSLTNHPELRRELERKSAFQYMETRLDFGLLSSSCSCRKVDRHRRKSSICSLQGYWLSRL